MNPVIEVEMNYGDEEYGVLADLIVGGSKSRTQQRIGTVIMILAGIYLAVMGIHGLFSEPTWLNAVCLIMAVAAFFLAFGGEKFLMRRSVIRRSKKANESSAGSYRKYTFSEKETTIESKLGIHPHPWSEYTAYGDQDHFLWLRIQDASYVLIDMNRMSEKDGAQLRSYCREKIR